MATTLGALLTCSVLYWFPIRRWMNRWGATASDVTRVMGLKHRAEALRAADTRANQRPAA
jgi:hypothetical protein